ncbi:MAG: cobalamin biosynthesis protein [Propionicimonas sp.]
MTIAAAVGLGLGWLADQAFGDPRRGHPVAGFGRLAGAWEKRLYADDRRAGTVFTATLVGGVAGLGWLAGRVCRGRPVAQALVTAAATWTVLGGRSLAREAEFISDALQADDLAAARARLPHLVSRDPAGLDADQIARATLESVAENTSDAVVAPLFWGAVAGLPGLLGYRAINTLDAMVGYRNPRYRNFGWASARLDDLANWLPARLAGELATRLAFVVGGRAEDAARAVAEQAPAHPSPNGGVVEAAFAGALGVTLGGTNSYDGVAENRGELGTGPAPTPPDLARGVKLAQAVGLGSALIAIAIARGRR